MRYVLLSYLFLSALQAAPISFEKACWIWDSEKKEREALSHPAGAVYFRGAFAVTEQTKIEAADLAIAADNLFEVYLNGRFVCARTENPDEWSKPSHFNVTDLIQAGNNVIAAAAANTAAGPAGLVVKLNVRLADGQVVTVASDGSWKSCGQERPNWQQPDFNDQDWRAAHEEVLFGQPPWGSPAVPESAAQPGLRESSAETAPPAGYPWPEAVLFVGDDCSLYRGTKGGTSYDSLGVTTFNPSHSRAYPEHDLPAPIKVGHKLCVLKPAKPGVVPQVLLDAGTGAIGSPAVSFDGRTIYFSMAAAGSAFFHIYSLPTGGGAPRQLTDGPFHDIDPVELPDGRIVFTSTRIGTFEEYHNPPSRALFAMKADGSGIYPLTHTFIFDNEPEVLADGRLLFIRSDNFFDRGKVETLLHAVHPDGSDGYTEFGLDLGPEYGNRLRAFNCGSPAPMPDGRVAFTTGSTIAIGRPGAAQNAIRHLRVEAGDVAALPDGRLLCTTRQGTTIRSALNGQGFSRIAAADPESGRLTPLYASETPLHSPVFLGARPRPPLLAERIRPERTTGVLYCQNARLTRNSTAGWPHVRAIRVLAGQGLTLRSSHSYIVHAGSDVTDLGTVPLAPDGSFSVEVPADTAIAFQAVDAEGRSELNEMSWIYVRPGETRGCIGCHQPRQDAPPAGGGRTLAMRTPPLRLLGQGRPLRFRGNNAAVTGLMEMQFDRYREVAGLNRQSDSVAALIAQLKGSDEGLRLSSAQRLAVFRDSAAAPALAECLKDSCREVRVAAAVALATCGTRESLAPLQAAGSDADPLLKLAATMAVENLTGNAAEADLVSSLASPNRDTVRRAAVALGHTAQLAAAREALRAYVARERASNPYPEWRRNHNGDGARFNSLSEANPRTLQAAVRALGSLKDAAAIPLLSETLLQHSDPASGNLFLAEAAAEALGRIATPEAEESLTGAFARLKDYPQFTSWYGDHGALMACHASPVHGLIIEALDAMGSTRAGGLLAAHLIRSVPTDCDRALMLENDDYETLVGRVIRRGGAEDRTIETCLAILGDSDAKKTPEIESALGQVHGSWAGRPTPEIRAAQILSLTVAGAAYEPRIRAAFDRYKAREVTIARVFDHGIPVVNELPVKHWVCFFLARAMGNLRSPASVDALVSALKDVPPEFAGGSPDPLGPGVLFLHNDLTPCWRAAAAWALGRIAEPRSAPALLAIVRNLDNAPDTRHAAAVALRSVADDQCRGEIARLAPTYPDVATRKVLLATAP